MSLPSRQYKQEIEFVIDFLKNTFLTTISAFSRNVLVQDSSVFK